MVQYTHKLIRIIHHIDKQKPHDNLKRYKEGFGQSSTSLHGKSSEEMRTSRNIPQHNKVYA